MTCKHLAIVAVGKDWKYLIYKKKRLTFCVSKNLSFLLPCVLHCILKLPLKGSSHDMTSSFFDCLEISTCVCVPSLRHTSLFRPSQYDSHLHINSLVRIHRFFFGSGPKTFTLIFITWLLWHMSFQASHISVIMQMRWNITPLQQMARDDNNGDSMSLTLSPRQQQSKIYVMEVVLINFAGSSVLILWVKGLS